ncbi:hypothetical protein TRVA0_022S01046 [Trichomonascus vanleenenianus]|uniref:Mgp12p n=1 Tax=Trichomonascus vanleenenianus TaxID=2268995 RepID=UPI003ECADC1A
MRASLARLAAQVTFFTRPKCGLCDEAKMSLSRAWEKAETKFEYTEVDITKPDNQKWFDLYAFDVPVVHIEEDGALKKLMHRMSVDEVLESLNNNNKK